MSEFIVATEHTGVQTPDEVDFLRARIYSLGIEAVARAALDWSDPVQLRLERTDHGYELRARLLEAAVA